MSYAGGSRPQVLLDGLTDEQLRQQYARRDASNDFEAMPKVNGAPIVESGSNSDGEWTRWADGTQHCWYLESDKTVAYSGYGSIYRSDTALNFWRYPQPFVSKASAVAVPGPSSDSGTFAVRVQGAGNSGVDLIFFSGSGGTQTPRPRCFSFGRWK